MTLVYISLLINSVVAGFWGIVLSFKLFPKLAAVYGIDGPGLRILGSMYLSIALISLTALLWPTYALLIITILFPFQIIYKLLTLPFVGTLRHPVVRANLVIAIILAITWYHSVYYSAAY